MEQTKNKNILYVLIAASFIIHMAISWMSLSDTKFSLLPNADEPKPIRMKLMPTKELKQIVQSQKSLDNTKNDSKLLSEKNNTFARETKASTVGVFKAAGKGQRNALNQKTRQVSKQKTKRKFKNIKLSDIGINQKTAPKVLKKKKQAKVVQTRKGLKNGDVKSSGLGRTNDFLADIPLGDFTKLNTQEYEYYGFYHRIRQKLEQFWGLNIQEQANKIFKQGRSIASDSNLITGLTIRLNERGEIVDIVLKSTSGVKELDDAAVESFNQAGPFPNPPKGMLQNGKATIDWGFVVNT
ncbi:MAG: hypothetical protein CME65_11690 [Halobacteriovoraceae bacterium]|nr:hypothetical protein [Halobacteriovoraceae bacterium]|tara:strand:+ start:8626 stop:9513 length:888 start_codon:yes stop_codon:yes gene_type:complete